jgi:hypothetical protein
MRGRRVVIALWPADRTVPGRGGVADRRTGRDRCEAGCTVTCPIPTKPSPRLRFGGDVTDGDVDLGYLQTG